MSNGIAFSGGGLKIFAHMGVLKALEELDLKFDYVSGTSSGSAVATLYSLGISADEMLKLLYNNYSKIVEIETVPIIKSGIRSMIKKELSINSLIDGAKIENLVIDIFKDRGITKKVINEVDKNLAVVSCDTVTTKEIVFLSKDFNLHNTERTDYITNAPIATAVRASMSFPGVFSPCDYKDYNLIDGGTVDNIPSKILRDMGSEKVLGVCFKLNPYKPKDDILKVALRASDIFSILNMSVAKQYVDLLIELDIPDTGLLDINDVDKVYKLGYEQAMKQKDNILNMFK